MWKEHTFWIFVTFYNSSIENFELCHDVEKQTKQISVVEFSRMKTFISMWVCCWQYLFHLFYYHGATIMGVNYIWVALTHVVDAKDENWVHLHKEEFLASVSIFTHTNSPVWQQSLKITTKCNSGQLLDAHKWLNWQKNNTEEIPCKMWQYPLTLYECCNAPGGNK